LLVPFSSYRDSLYSFEKKRQTVVEEKLLPVVFSSYNCLGSLCLFYFAIMPLWHSDKKIPSEMEVAPRYNC